MRRKHWTPSRKCRPPDRGAELRGSRIARTRTLICEKENLVHTVVWTIKVTEEASKLDILYGMLRLRSGRIGTFPI